MVFWKNYRYKNLTLFGISVLIAITLSRFEQFHAFLLHLGNLGYFGAFIAGALFVSTFTVATGAIILLILAERLSPLEIAVVGAFGGVIGDLTIFHFVKDNLLDEITPLYEKFGGKHFHNISHSKYFAWTGPVLGAIIMASPLPDELGVSLMGISKMKTYQFILVSFVLNVAGIFLIVSLSPWIKP